MKKNLVFIILIIAMLIATGTSVVNRINVEKEAKSVEFVLDYTEFKAMADQSEHEFDWWLNHFKSLGVASVALNEETVYSLMEEGREIEAEVLMNLKSDTLWELRYPKSFIDYINNNNFDENDVVIALKDEDLLEFIINGLSKYPDDFYTLYEGENSYAILLDGLYNELIYTTISTDIDIYGRNVIQRQAVVDSQVLHYGLGFNPEKIDEIQKAGLTAHLRPLNNKRFSDVLLSGYFEALKTYGIQPNLVIFAGKEVIGYPGSLIQLNDWMTENHVAPVLIETSVQRSNIEQEGLFDLVDNLDYQAVRLLPIIDYLQQRYKAYNYQGGEEIENTIFRAVIERNIRLVYLRPYKWNNVEFVTDPEEYQASFERLTDRFSNHNISIGQISFMPYKSESTMSAVLVGLGIISLLIFAARFYLKLPLWLEYAGLVVGGLLIYAALVVAPNLGRQLLALAAGLTISTIGALILVEFARERYLDRQIFKTRIILLKSMIIAILMGLLAMIGGLMIGGLLSHSKYLLEIDYFRGVKISEMLPLGMFVLFYLLKFGFRRSSDEIRKQELLTKDLWKMVNTPIKISYVILGGIAAFALYIYIARSGHETSVQPSNLEMIVRNFLELKLIARPRTKEFLMAVPAVMTFVYVVYKGYKPLIPFVGIPATILFTSIINTFCHLRSPIYLSVSRTLLGIGMGVIIGLIALVIYEIIERLVKRFLKYKLHYETNHQKELGA
ncbi:MAG: MFS transporter [Clostridia bacterium]|nr:MFS transporter [Clostridia bacterium]